MMRLVVATVQDDEAAPLLEALTTRGYRATRIGGTGSPLRAGTATLLIGIPGEQLAAVLGLIADVGHAINGTPAEEPWYSPDPAAVGGPTHVSVLKVVRFERL